MKYLLPLILLFASEASSQVTPSPTPTVSPKEVCDLGTTLPVAEPEEELTCDLPALPAPSPSATPTKQSMKERIKSLYAEDTWVFDLGLRGLENDIGCTELQKSEDLVEDFQTENDGYRKNELGKELWELLDKVDEMKEEFLESCQALTSSSFSSRSPFHTMDSPEVVDIADESCEELYENLSGQCVDCHRQRKSCEETKRTGLRECSTLPTTVERQECKAEVRCNHEACKNSNGCPYPRGNEQAYSSFKRKASFRYGCLLAKTAIQEQWNKNAKY